MFLIIVIILITIIYFEGIPIGYNRTLGWGWDPNYWLFITYPVIWLLLLLGYGILALIKAKTHYLFSSLQLIGILLLYTLHTFLHTNYFLIIAFCIFTLIIFFINFSISIKNKKLPR